MKKKGKQIFIIIFILIVLGSLYFIFNNKKQKISKQENIKVFIMDDLRHLEKKLFKEIAFHQNTQVINLSNQKENLFSPNEIKLTSPIPTDKELELLNKDTIYLAYCSQKSCSNELFKKFYEKGIALYDLKNGI